jgi:hypothetical protein
MAAVDSVPVSGWARVQEKMKNKDGSRPDVPANAPKGDVIIEWSLLAVE